jgi:hypothetical protein
MVNGKFGVTYSLQKLRCLPQYKISGGAFGGVSVPKLDSAQLEAA